MGFTIFLTHLGTSCSNLYLHGANTHRLHFRHVCSPAEVNGAKVRHMNKYFQGWGPHLNLNIFVFDQFLR